MKFEEYYLKEEDMPQYQLFCDMDGVLTDWEQAFLNLGVTKLTGEKFEEKNGKAALWAVITKHGKLDFWENMPWTEDGKKLWNYIKKHKPTILTTPARNKYSRDGKKLWIARELGKDVEYIFEKDKFKHANPQAILIDDFDTKINDWVNHDGVGILHVTADDTIKQLKEFGF